MSRFVMSDDVRVENFDWGDIGWRSAETTAKQFVVMDVALEPGGGHNFHKHPRQEEMIIVKTGQIEQWLEDRSETLRPGDSVYIDPDVVHASFNTGDETALLQVVVAPAMPSEATGYEVVDVSAEQPWASLRRGF